MPESWEQLQDYIQRIEQENAELLKQVAMLSCEIERYEEQHR